MWNEMKTMFESRQMNVVDLRSSGMQLYYEKDIETNSILVYWLISDREMRNMNRVQYQRYLIALGNQFRGSVPSMKVCTLILSDDGDYAGSLCGGLDQRMYTFWIANPKTEELYMSPCFFRQRLLWLETELRELLRQDKVNTVTGVTRPDWQNSDLWGHKSGMTAEEARQLQIKSRKFSSYATVALIVINVAVFILCFVVGLAVTTGRIDYLSEYLEPSIEFGATSGSLIFEEWQIYRLVTAIFMHAGIEHLFGNMLALFVFGDVIEKFLKKKKYLTLYMIAGVGSALVAAFWRYLWVDSRDLLGVGASGAIYGLLGALTVLLFLHPEQRKKGIGLQVWAIPAYVLYSTAYPFVVAWISDVPFSSISIDFAAHISGFLIGGLVFRIMDRKANRSSASFG